MAIDSEKRIVNWGFVGASTWARRYLVPIVEAMPDSCAAGVYSSSAERGGRFAKETGLRRSYASLPELLADPDIDVVYVSTTNDLHAEQTIAAARAGKHVLCEKPLALTLADATRMGEECVRAGVVLATNHAFRAGPALRRSRELIASGEIGEVVAAQVCHAVYLPEELQTWRLRRPEAGAGVILDLTVHDADTTRFLFGDEVAEVTALAASQGLAAEGVADSAMGVMRMSGGQLVSFHDSFNVRHARTGIEVHGTTGSLLGRDVFAPESPGELLLRRGEELEPLELDVGPSIYEEAVRRFNAAVRNEGSPLASGADGIASLAVALAVAESARTGASVKPATNRS